MAAKYERVRDHIERDDKKPKSDLDFVRQSVRVNPRANVVVDEPSAIPAFTAVLAQRNLQRSKRTNASTELNVRTPEHGRHM